MPHPAEAANRLTIQAQKWHSRFGTGRSQAPLRGEHSLWYRHRRRHLDRSCHRGRRRGCTRWFRTLRGSVPCRPGPACGQIHHGRLPQFEQSDQINPTYNRMSVKRPAAGGNGSGRRRSGCLRLLPKRPGEGDSPRRGGQGHPERVTQAPAEPTSLG